MDFSENALKKVRFTHKFLSSPRLKYDADSLKSLPQLRAGSLPRIREILPIKPRLINFGSRSPKTTHSSIYSLASKSKLNCSIITKHIFVMQDGSCVSPGQKLQGFKYPVHQISGLPRTHQDQEMKDFFDYCKDYYKSPIPFRFLFSHKGKRLRCLHEISSKAKIALVGHSPEFQGILKASALDSMRFTRSPCYRFSEKPSESSLDVSRNINSMFVYSTQKCNSPDQDQVLPSLKTPRKRMFKRVDYNKHLNSFERLKVKLGDVAAKIGRDYSPIHDQGMRQFKERYKFSESELHKLYARFKLLTLLSCGVNPSHKLKNGVVKQAFVEYYGSSSELTYVLERIFDKIDSEDLGFVTWPQFLEAMHTMWYGTYNQQIDLFFNVYDVDGSGNLSFTEIQALCRVQLQDNGSDSFIDELAASFAGLIFDIAQADYTSEISSDRIKEIINTQNDKSLIDMFCTFDFLRV